MYTAEQFQEMLKQAIKTGKDMKALNRKWCDAYKRSGDSFYVGMISRKLVQYHNNKRIIALIKENI